VVILEKKVALGEIVVIWRKNCPFGGKNGLDTPSLLCPERFNEAMSGFESHATFYSLPAA
jgi:hypothetical protein